MSGWTDLDDHEPAPAPVVFHGKRARKAPRDGLEPMEGPSVSLSVTECLHDLAERRPMLVLAAAVASGWLLGKLGSK